MDTLRPSVAALSPMNLPGPSRVVPLPSRERIESTYEQDLRRLLDQLTLQERDESQASLKRRIGAGGRLSDYDVAFNDLIQQARELDEDRILAERIAVEEEEDVAVDQPSTAQPEPSPVDPRPNLESKKRRRSKRKSRVGQVAQGSAPRSLPHPIHERKEQFATPQAMLWVSGPPLSNRKGKQTEREVNRQFGIPAAPVSSPVTVRWCKGVISSSGLHFAFGSLPSEPGPTNVPVSPRAANVKRPTGHDCVICQDPIYGTEIQAPCGHHYDIACVTDLFKSATRDETLFPPRCCKQTIPFIQVRSHLSQTLIATFQEKKVEFGTLKRVYCSSPTCSRFLGPLLEGDSPGRAYSCPCSRKTCGKCREQHSTSVNRAHVCRPDATATDVLELGRASGWARCPGCSQMIELDIGCFHMTCRCRTEFCYLCRARWKTCPCDQWDEQRLLTAAEQRVDARLGADRGQGVGHDAAPQQHRREPALMGNRFAVLFDDGQPAHPTRTAPTGSGAPLERRRRPGRFEDGVPNMNAIRARMVLEMMERLRVDHDCHHIQWRYQDDGGDCDNCGQYLPLYLFRCEDCEMLACSRCRRNRL